MSPLTLSQITHHLNTLLPHWSHSEKTNQIQRHFHFTNYYETMAFVNAIAWIAHETNHHPDLLVGYSTCLVSYSTHDAKGITMKDIQCAEKINQLRP